jgi:probable HAF family extracellular repeat protein
VSTSVSTSSNDGRFNAVVWSDGQLVDLGAGLDSQATDLNDLGQVVGFATNPEIGVQDAFRRQQGTLTFLGGPPGAVGSQARGINRAGDVVGASWGADGLSHGVLWPAGSTVPTPLEPPDYDVSLAEAIDDDGVIAGSARPVGGFFAGVVRRAGTLVLVQLGGSVQDVNRRGELVGIANNAALWRP